MWRWLAMTIYYGSPVYWDCYKLVFTVLELSKYFPKRTMERWKPSIYKHAGQRCANPTFMLFTLLKIRKLRFIFPVRKSGQTRHHRQNVFSALHPNRRTVR